MRCFRAGGYPTYNDSRNSILGIAVPLQLLRYRNEDTRWQGHVEHSVLLMLASLDLLEVPIEVLEGLILIILTRNVGAELAKALELLLDLFCRHLDVRFHSSQILCMVHFRAGIADDLDVFGKEFVAILSELVNNEPFPPIFVIHIPSQRELGTEASLASEPLAEAGAEGITNSLLLGKIARGAKHHDDSVIFELDRAG